MVLDPTKKYSIDTSILIFAINQESIFHKKKKLISSGLNNDFELYLCGKVLYEFIAVASNTFLKGEKEKLSQFARNI